MKTGRNELCPCGSGKKHKHCCLNIKDDREGSPIDYGMDYISIKNDFINNNISVNVPGFYDDNNFLKIEKRYPEYLSNYARYVQTKEYSVEYLKQAEKEIPFIAELLYSELEKDGRKGACIDVSMCLSRILELEGYWNYLVKGAMTISFSSGLNISDKYFYPVDITSAAAGHAWVVAPPFGVIDITLRHQPYKDGAEKYIPKYVIDRTNEIATVEVNDIFSVEAKNLYSKKHNCKARYLLALELPNVVKATSVFTPLLIRNEFSDIKYITVAIAAPDGKLDQMMNLYLNGKNSSDIYSKVIKPALTALRES